jgi:hypothetical protein
MHVVDSTPIQSPKSRSWIRLLRRLSYVTCGLMILAGTVVAYARNRVTAYTSKSPIALPKQRLSRDHLARVERRLEKISNQVINYPQVQRDFLISTEEINTLVHKEPKLRDKIFVKISDDQLKADVCFPADLLPGGAGRFFNAEVTIEPKVENGKLKLTVKDALVDGQSVPEVWMKLVRERNFAKPLYNDAEIAQILANVESVMVEPYGMRFILRTAANAKQLVLQARNSDRTQVQ